MAETTVDVVNANFVGLLEEINKGHSVAELSEALETLVRAVRETGRAGKMRYEIAIKPATEGGDVDQVFVEDSIMVKAPTHKRKAALFFATTKNTLTRENPNQMQLHI